MSPASRISPPLQSRSRQTLERLVRASLAILESEGPAGLTVQGVVARARSSVGSFYARFGGKEDLLEYLSERLWREALERWNEALASRSWGDLDLARVVESVVGLLVDVRQSSSSYLESLDRMPGAPSGAHASFQKEVLAGLAGVLLARRTEFRHPDPELGVGLGLRAVMGVIDAQDRGIADELPRDLLIRECSDLLTAYLVGSATDDGDRESVEFFDIWG